MVHKNGLGDLQKGERYVMLHFKNSFNSQYNRYANTDFILFSTLAGIFMTLLMISYDIACQWSRNLKKRVT